MDALNVKKGALTKSYDTESMLHVLCCSSTISEVALHTTYRFNLALNPVSERGKINLRIFLKEWGCFT